MFSSKKSNTHNRFQLSTENINTSNRKKNSPLTAPSLLFYKPQEEYFPHKISTQTKLKKKDSKYFCANHHSIQASFTTKSSEDDGQTIFFCSQCAKYLKKQGLDIYPIQTISSLRNSSLSSSSRKSLAPLKPLYPFPEREAEVEEFLQILDEKMKILDGSSHQVKDILISSEEFYGQQIQQINEYFDAIAQSLQLQKNKCYNHILLERQSAQKNTRDTLKKLIDNEKEVEAMISDIKQNLDSVFSISWENYTTVMEAFDGRLKEVEKAIDELREEGLHDVEFRKIQFAGVPEAIHSLSNLIIHNNKGYEEHQENFSDISCGQKTIFDRLKTNNDDNSSNIINETVSERKHERHSSLMFSFDEEAMKNCRLGKSEGEENGDQKVDKGDFSLRGSSEDEQFSLRRAMNKRFGVDNEKDSFVEGIPQVQEVDVLDIPEEYFAHSK